MDGETDYCILAVCFFALLDSGPRALSVSVANSHGFFPVSFAGYPI